MIRLTRYDGVGSDLQKRDVNNAEFIGRRRFGRRTSEAADVATRRYKMCRGDAGMFGRVGEADNFR